MRCTVDCLFRRAYVNYRFARGTSGICASNEEGFTRSLFCKPQYKELVRDGNRIKVFTGLVDNTNEHVGDQFVKLQLKVTYKHDLDFNALEKWINKRFQERNRLRQIVSTQSIESLGLDLAVAHVVCGLGGRVQFNGNSEWFQCYAGLKSQLPNSYVGNWKIQAIDLSGTNVVYEGFEYLPYLTDLQYLRLRRCVHVNDFCLSRVGRISNLRLLDVSECPRLTSKGLATLTQLKDLQRLIVSGNPLMEDKELVCLLLEDHLPKLQIEGVDYIGKLSSESQEKIFQLASGKMNEQIINLNSEPNQETKSDYEERATA